MLLAGLCASCSPGGEGEEAAAKTTPIDQLIREGKAPVEVGNLIRGISPVAPTFSLSVTNISDRPVSLVNGTVLFYDQDGKALPDSKAESGYSDLIPIPPGGKIGLSIMTENENAVSGKWIIKEVLYDVKNPLGESFPDLPKRWTNPNFDADLAAAEKR
jgi:hypothetical protein